MTQTDAILEHLQTKGSITSMEAFECYGATRLSAIIFSLRHKGLTIDSNNKLVKNRYGRSVYVSHYTLKKGK